MYYPSILTFLLLFIGAVQVMAQCNSPLDLGNDTTKCVYEDLLLNAGSYDSYLWQDNSTDPTFLATQAGIYYCTTTFLDEGNNLIVNGDFESGNVSFTSTYTYYPIADVTGPQGSYGIINNPQTWFAPFTPCGDNTTGFGNMLVADGSIQNNGNNAVWCQTVNVEANTEYIVSHGFLDVVGPPTANLELQVNGVSLGSELIPVDIFCQWNEVSYTWNSGNSTTAEVCIFDLEFAASGNDFAIDDITMYPMCMYTDTIIVTDIPIMVSAVETTLCAGDSVFVGNGFQTEAGVYIDTVTFDPCIEITETTVIVEDIPLAVAPSDTSVFEGESVTITAALVEQGILYRWIDEDGNISISSALTVTPITSASYVLMATNGDCASYDTIFIAVLNPPIVDTIAPLIPNAFTPNGDGLNDVFEVVNKMDFRTTELRVFNAWGEVVFQSAADQNGWDGSYKGRLQNQGVYYYTVVLESPDNSISTHTGAFHLLH